MIVIGLDVHKQSVTAVAVDEAGRPLAEKLILVGSDELLAILRACTTEADALDQRHVCACRVVEIAKFEPFGFGERRANRLLVVHRAVLNITLRQLEVALAHLMILNLIRNGLIRDDEIPLFVLEIHHRRGNGRFQFEIRGRHMRESC